MFLRFINYYIIFFSHFHFSLCAFFGEWITKECFIFLHVLFLKFVILFFQGLTSTAVKKGRLYTADVGSQFKYNQSTVDVKFDANSNVCIMPHFKIYPYYMHFIMCVLQLLLPDFVNHNSLRNFSIYKSNCDNQVSWC